MYLYHFILFYIIICYRFDVNNIKKIFLKDFKNFLHIFKNYESEKKTGEIIKKKINSIEKINLLQKFIADCYNNICNESIKIISKEVRNKKTYIGVSYQFKY